MALDRDDLTEAESRLVDAFRTGRELDVRVGDPDVDDVGAADDWGPERTVRAKILVALLLGAEEAEPGHVAALRLTGARITDVIDLDYAEVRTHVRLKECSIPERVYVYGARTRQLSLVGSHLAQGLDASFASIDGNLRLIGCRIEGELTLAGAHVSGSVMADRARITVTPATVATSDVAVDAPRLRVDGDLSCLEGFEAHGEVNLRSARIAGDIRLTGATLTAPGGNALLLTSAEVSGSLMCVGVTAQGQLRMRNTRIADGAWFSDTRIDGGDDFALYAVDAEIGQDLRCTPGFVAEGGVDLSEAKIGAHVRFDGAKLSRPHEGALLARGVKVGRNVYCSDGFTAAGSMRFNGAEIGGLLSFHQAELNADQGFALTLTWANARELDLRTTNAPASADLTLATVGVLRDDPKSWPAVLRLDGLRYEQLHRPDTARERAKWLQRDDRLPYLPGPYEQLSAFYRRMGHDDEARRVLLIKQRARRRTLAKPARIWGAVQDAVVGYGYQPERALAWLIGLVGLGALLFAVHHPTPTGTGTNPPFNSLIYSLDLLLPVINFGVAHDYTSQGAYQWFAYLLTAAGWILATTIAAGVARAVNRS
jgi:hypothetical protein